MREVLRLYFDRDVWRRLGILACILPGTFAESIGLASLVPLFAIVTGAQSASKSALGRAVIGAFEKLGVTPDVPTLLVIIVFGFTIKELLSLWAANRTSSAIAAMTTGFRINLIDQLISARWQYFAGQPSGRFLHAIGDAPAAAGAFQSATNVLVALINAAAYLALALLVSWRVFLVAIIVGLVSSFLLRRFVKQAKYFGRKQARHNRSLVIEFIDVLTGLKSLKAMGKQHHLARLLRQRTARLRRAFRREAMSRALLINLREPIEIAGLGIAFFISVRYFSLDPGQLLLMALLIGRSVKALGKIQSSVQATAVSAPQYWSMMELLTETAAHAERWSGQNRPKFEHAIAFSDVSFSYGSHIILDQVFLTIEAGKLTAITGPSGIGKTTFADLVTGLNEPLSGEIRLDDQPLTDLDMGAWRRMIGYVPQEVILFNDTVFANLTLGDPSLTMQDAEDALRAAGAWGFVSGLPEQMLAPVGERGQSLSGGQRQRLAIARALIRRPKLLILDEATSALDPESEQGICDQIKTLIGPVTVLAITHRAAWVGIAHHRYRLEHRKLIAI